MFVFTYILIGAEATTEVVHEAASASGIGAIGVDGRALLFQIINFAILLFVLKLVAYKPILKVLSDRRSRIEASLKTAKEIEASREDINRKQLEILKEARVQADATLGRSRQEASEIIKQAEAKANAKAEQLLTEASQRIQSEVAVARAALKQEMTSLVVAATEVIIEDKLDRQKDEALLTRALEEALS